MITSLVQGNLFPQPTQGKLFTCPSQQEYEEEQSNMRKAGILIRRNWIVENGDISFGGMEPIDPNFEARFAAKVPTLQDFGYESVKAAMELVAKEIEQEGNIADEFELDSEFAVGL